MERLTTVINYIFFKGEGKYTPKQINRFLYYSYGIYLAVYNDDINSLDNRLFNDSFYTFTSGPIIEKANDYLEDNRDYYCGLDKEIKEHTDKLRYTDVVLDRRSKRIINAVLITYGKYSGNELEKMVLKEKPYKKSKKRNKIVKIDDKAIYDYFAKIYNENYQKNKTQNFALFKKPKMI